MRSSEKGCLQSLGILREVQNTSQGDAPRIQLLTQFTTIRNHRRLLLW